MKSFVLALALLMQAGPQSVGVVTGVVRGANGIPAPGIRVYAIGVRDTLEALNTGTAPLEGLTQSDASGRYRLEVTPGRYYIASGSVNSPTFYPGTANAAEARIVTVAAGGLVESIDFSNFVPAARSGLTGIQALANATGSLSGVVRYPDGTPATGIPVVLTTAASVTGGAAAPSAPPLFGNNIQQLIPANAPAVPGAFAVPPPSSAPVYLSYRINFAGGSRFFTTSDLSGRYTLTSIPPDSYYIAAGYAESSTLYPGVTDVSSAKTITTTPTTNMSTLDFTVARQPFGNVVVRGRVTALGGAPVGGVRVQIVSGSPAPASLHGLPSINPDRGSDVGPDGRFEFTNVRPGTYVVRASYSGIYSESRNIVVADQPLEGVDFLLRVSTLSGRLLAEDGSSFADARLFVDAVVSTVDNPNIIASTIFQITNDGGFGRILEPGEYRFFLRTLPEEYSIQSITAGGVNLMKETLKFTGKEPVQVEVRVAKKATSDPSAVRVSGRAIDAVSGVPSAAERVTLCCRSSGPVERFSAPVKADGSFEFAAIPPGRYAAGLQTKTGAPILLFVGGNVVVGQESVAGLEVLSTPQLGELSAKIVLENGSLPPENFPALVVFTGTNDRLRMVAARRRDGNYFMDLPVGDRYTVSVINLPAGYEVKSIIGSTEVRPQNYPAVGAPPPLAPAIVITLVRESR